jgi:hypothetical protein
VDEQITDGRCSTHVQEELHLQQGNGGGGEKTGPTILLQSSTLIDRRTFYYTLPLLHFPPLFLFVVRVFEFRTSYLLGRCSVA